MGAFNNDALTLFARSAAAVLQHEHPEATAADLVMLGALGADVLKVTPDTEPTKVGQVCAQLFAAGMRDRKAA